MIHSKKITIPLYFIDLRIIFANNLSEIQEKYNFTDLSKYSAITFENENSEYNECIVAFSEYDLSVIAHEIVHIKNYVFRETSMKLCKDNDEAEAYLTGYLFKQIEQFLIKFRFKDKQ